MTLLQKINDFVGELQKKNDREKRLWLIVSTAISMVIILIIWGFSFSSIIQNLGEQESTPKQNQFIATFRQGIKVIGEKIGLQMSKAVEEAQTYMQATNSVTIQPTNLNFSNTTLEPITPKKFP